MAHLPYEPGKMPKRARFRGLPTYAVNAFGRGMRVSGRDADQMTDAEISAITDDELLALPYVGAKAALIIRQRFPYRAQEAG